MTTLEDRLADLGDHLDVPPGEGLAAAVVQRLATAPAPRTPWWRRWWRWLAAAMLGLGFVGAAPALADWLGIGAVEVHDEPAPGLPTITLDPGEPVALEEVAARVGFEPLLPSALGPPEQVWVDERLAAPVVWMRWEGGPVLTQVAGSMGDGPILHKFTAGAEVDDLTVEGHPALWVGGPHDLVLHPAGAEAQRYEVAGTLLVELGALTVRVETRAGLDEAVRIASSLAGT